MLNQYYKYLSDVLLKFFKETEIKPGDRFYLQLDTHGEVEELVEVFKNHEDAIPFTYQHNMGEPYSTFGININNVNLVFANTSSNVKPDFLVTLRNQVGEQQGVWEKTALFSIVSEQLDSIEGGSSNLQKEGMPLHPSSLFQQLKTDIEKSNLTSTEVIILLDNLKRLMDDHFFQQVTLLDFEEIFEVLSKGKVEDKDYKKFGLFKDNELSTLKGNKLNDRLMKNRELFEYVQKVHDFGGSLDEELGQKFTQKGVQELKKEDWAEESFSDIARFAEEKIKESKKTKVELKKISIDKELVIWDRALSETSAGQRKRQIIIFNPNQEESVSLHVNFEIEGSEVKSLSKEFFTISKGSDVTLNVGKINATFEIPASKDKTTFIKIAYKHEGKASLGSEFHIAIFPCNEVTLKDLKTKYFVNVSNNCLELESDIEEIKFGDGYNSESIEIVSADEIIQIPEDTEITLIPQPEAFDDDDQLLITVEDNGCRIPIRLKNDLPEATPITGMRIWKMKREEAKDFKFQNNRLMIGNNEYYTHKEYKTFFEWEQKWVENNIQSAILDSEEVVPVSLELNEDLREAYSRFIQYFRINSIPSLCYYSDELKKRAQDYLQEYLRQIKSFEEGKAPGNKGRNLNKLGVMVAANEVYFTPFHPIVVAYQLYLTEKVGQEPIDNMILSRLKPDSLIPFIYNDHDQLYKPDSQSHAPEWIRFKPVREVTVSDASQYLAKVVHEKITQFEEHFEFLFLSDSKAPLQLNVVNITNDKEILRGIVNWIIEKIEEKGPDELKPVEVSLYMDISQQSAFDEFSRMEKLEQVKSYLNINLKSSKYDESDILRFIRENLFYFKHSNDEKSYRYGHISFYKMHAQQHRAHLPMKDMVTGISLDGVFSTVPSMKGEENYRSGFGIKGCQIDDNILLQTAFFANELAANMFNGGNDTYKKGEGIVSRTDIEDEETLSKIFDASYWVTFIDPSVDLEFFQKYDRNLVVIHYNDQFTSSSRYDAITVTDKSNQFNSVIKEILVNKDIEVTEENIVNTIKAFNTFNGEWLLRIAGSKGHFDREKLSIISAIKYSLAYFNHPKILWVPISLEEILRVAGAVSLNKREGVFTAKNLGVTGKHSDDLLLVGLEHGDTLKLHYYPVEVKIGNNPSGVFEKAKEQIYNTRKLFDNELIYKDGKKTFKNQFYRNFFAQIFIANAKKIKQSELWDEGDYKLSEEIIEKLLSDDYEVSTDLKSLIGEGAIISFQKDAYLRTSSLEDNVTILNLTLHDGFEGIVKSIQNLTEKIQTGKTDFVKERLISYNYKYERSSEQETNFEEKIDHVSQDNEESDLNIIDSSNLDNKQTTVVVDENDGIELPNDNERTDSTPLEKVRILIGKALNSNKQIYWEYGNKNLANRHLLISGNSGQGKTYFMQCLLLEKAKQGISSIVIDYTEGFLPNQLEPEFVEYLGNNLKQSVVYNERFPINPFKRNVRDIGGLTFPENETDVAERIKSVFGAVYSTLGIQQLNAIYEATINGLHKYGDSMDLQKLKLELEEEGSNYAKTALSQIRPLIDRNPFNNSSELDWKEIIESDGQVFVIQLTGYPRDVQLMITEFILWDLWNYAVRNGNKNIPMPVVMDEAQNLDHTENSPSARILQEGRKFGWSAWYATQFLKSQLDASELARLQMASEKVYFAPPDQEVSYIAGSLSYNPNDKKEWEKKLSSLKKGQCIVNGPVLDDRGELTQPIVTVVNITPLWERI
ncbi:DNA phosphorothioation-dependent restriction protein DptH [Fredinandcohnia onubensis]|uniref:DNA phosphorothioation-dependent restriction protein DptH n=1 Tax=Fredinandcohnia onubensis TaxID=1571209 RepID=UPI000C0BC79C|nr:DNA phosphorothioation-dependent restriction protein DptH [Fredinandcohnia onubensis]